MKLGEYLISLWLFQARIFEFYASETISQSNETYKHEAPAKRIKKISEKNALDMKSINNEISMKAISQGALLLIR